MVSRPAFDLHAISWGRGGSLSSLRPVPKPGAGCIPLRDALGAPSPPSHRREQLPTKLASPGEEFCAHLEAGLPPAPDFPGGPGAAPSALSAAATGPESKVTSELQVAGHGLAVTSQPGDLRPKASPLGALAR